MIMRKIIEITLKTIKSNLKNMISRLRGLVDHDRFSRGLLYQYWRQPNDEFNAPHLYIPQLERSKLLLKLIKEYVDFSGKILEIGCNVGRNLNYLFNAGFKHLEGNEISKEAIDLMVKTYPKMAKEIKIYNNPVEWVIKNYESNYFDLVFTMAVLQHIHPDSEWIFPEMARITKKYLITVEDEKGVSWRHFPRNYKQVFDSCGMKQIYELNCKGIKGFNSNFWARVFIK